ncbi:MAG: glycosyltransferase [Schleiferiaceae bacterium]|nr:glycosyltransferase [Schleiferiaceae bacterium]
MPKVSVIIPNYNHAAFLPKRIHSVLGQTFTDFEVIILDDCSPDNSREIIDKYAGKSSVIRTHYNTENTGSTFAQWNKGVALAKGEYIWIAESDDFAEITLLETLVPLLDNNPNVGIAYAQSMLVDENDQLLHSFNEHYQFVYQSGRWKSDFIADGREECANYLMYHNVIPNASGALLRKSVYTAAGGADPTWKLNGDWYFYVKMLLISDVAFCAKHLNYFRMHSQTQRHKANANAKVYDELIHTLTYIEQSVPVPPEVSKEAWHRVASWWAGSLYRQDITKTYFQHNWKLYTFFRKKRPRLALNIISNSIFLTIGWVLQLLGIKKVIKHWRAKLFPKKFFKY